MNGAEYLLRAVGAEGVDHVFMVPGGLDDSFMPPMTSIDGLTTVVAAHEGGAAYLADGYARASGRFGVAFGIGGPGVMNMTTAVASARCDRSPMLIVSGEVPTSKEGLGAFQDASGPALDDVAVLRSVAAASMTVASPALLDHHLRVGLTAMWARREPVHLSVPVDVQQADQSGFWRPLAAGLERPRPVDEGAVTRLLDVLAPTDGAALPARLAVLAGQGVVWSEAWDELRAFAERWDVPVATTLLAKGVLAEDHPLALGGFGYAGTRWATEGLLGGQVDVLLVLGADLTQRNTMYWSPRLVPRVAMVHVDADPEMIDRTYPVEVPVVGDVGEVLRRLVDPPLERHRAALEAGRAARRAWLAEVRGAGPRVYEPEHQESEAFPLHPARVVAELRRAAPRDTVLCVDSGAHRAWCGHYWEAYEPRSYLSATNLGPMGAAIPLGVGAKLARPERPCVVVTGDGCMLMHGMELHTAVRHRVPVVVVVVDNQAYGNIWFRASAMGPGPEGLTEIPSVDWAAFARSVGAEAIRVERPDELAPAFERALVASSGPVLVDVRCDKRFPTPVHPWKEAAKEWEDHH